MILTFTYRFEAAHRFLHSSDKCATPHGHTWWAHLNLEHDDSMVQKDKNLAQDFYKLKAGWKSYIENEIDHHFFLNADDPLKPALLDISPSAKLKCLKGDPTTEALAFALFNVASDIFKDFPGIDVKSLKLQETPTNAVEVSSLKESYQFI